MAQNLNVELERVILRSAQEYNILPLTSGCNLRCVFCSHPQNPPGIQVYTIPPRSLEEIERTLEFIDGSRKIVIGESATRIIEGEPFTHPQILTALQLLRRRFPQTLLSITTNGTRLTEELITALVKLSPLELNVSLNSATTHGRKRLMRDHQAERAIAGIKTLAKAGLPWHGSMLTLPHIVGWDDLTETINFMSEHGARTIRVFLPGYTRWTPEIWHIHNFADLLGDIVAWAEEIRRQVPVPLLLEPVPPADLVPVVAGVIPGSIAEQAGLSAGDVIEKVNGVKCFSRVDAWQKIYRAASSCLEVRTGSQRRTFTLKKPAHTSPGLVMVFDLDPADWQAALREIDRNRARRVLLMTSRLARTVLQTAVETYSPVDCQIELLMVENRFFGGTIACAGLLVVEDFLSAWQEWSSGRLIQRPDLILLPGRAFDHRGCDLVGRGYWEIEEKTGITTRVI